MSEETKWYSLRVISGKERSIKERIDKEIKAEGWEEYVPNVIVPTEKVYKIRNGKKVIQERNILPGYILIEALPSKLRGDVVSQITNVVKYYRQTDKCGSKKMAALLYAGFRVNSFYNTRCKRRKPRQDQKIC